MGIQRDYYSILKISPKATTEEIKVSFRRLARQYHPDLNPNDPESAEYFKQISEAYETLSDPPERRRYDLELKLINKKPSGRKNVDNASPNHTIRKKSKTKDAQYYYRRGIEQGKKQQYQKAITEYSRAIAADKNFIDAYLQRAQMRHKLGDNHGVLDDCYRLITINSTVVKAYYYQGRARYHLGYVQASIDSYSEAIRQDKDYSQAYYYRGLAYGDIKEKNLAIQDLLIAAELFRLEGNYDAYNLANKKISLLNKSRFKWINLIKSSLVKSIILTLIFPMLVISVAVFTLTQFFNIENLYFLLLFSIFLLLLFLFLWSKLYNL